MEKSEGQTEFLVFWGLPESGQEEFRTTVAADHQVVSSVAEVQEALAAGKPCLLEGGNLTQAERAPFIEAAFAAGAEVRAMMFQFDVEKYPTRYPVRRGRTVASRYSIPGELGKNDMPDLEEGFDEIRYAFKNDAGWTSGRYKAREPMFELVENPDGTTTMREMGREFYTIDRPGSMACCLMSRAAFEKLMAPRS